MKTIRLKEITTKNFKGNKALTVHFNDGKPTIISGQNATGKTSVYDAITYLMFGTDSLGRSNFAIRELDADGNKVHHTEIFVEGKYLIDGAEVVLTKIQKEKWTRKHGLEDRELTSNPTEYSINGYPKSKDDYKAYIADIIDEKIFKILTNPIAFPSLDWKEQRKILFSIIGVIDDSDMAEEVPYFDLLKKELAAASIDDIRHKYAKSKKELEKKPEELQTRIDEVSGQIVEEDLTPYKSAREAALAQIEILNKELTELSKVNNSEIDGKIAELESQIRITVREANADRDEAVRNRRESVRALKNSLEDAERELRKQENALEEAKQMIDKRIADKEQYATALREAEDKEFPRDKAVCDKCGQVLPEDQIEVLEKNWNTRKQDTINRYKAAVEKCGKEAVAWLNNRDVIDSNIQTAKTKINNFKIALDVAQAELLKAESVPEVDDTCDKCAKIRAEIAILNAKRFDMVRVSEKKTAVEKSIGEQKSIVFDAESHLNEAKQNDARKARIAELENEMRKVGQNISNCDKMLFAVDGYVKALSKRINDRFDGLEFKLFDTQMNGGVKEDCQITIDGVPYSALNSGHKIIAGLNIIKVLRDYYQVDVPTIVDNAESLSTDNVPQMPGQLILLRVSDEPTLTVS